MCLILQVGQLRKRGVNNSHAGLKLFPADILPISSCCTDMESKSKLCWLHRFQSANAVDSDVIDSTSGTAQKRGVNNSHAGLKLFPADILPISSCCTDMESKSKLCLLHRFQSERQHG